MTVSIADLHFSQRPTNIKALNEGLKDSGKGNSPAPLAIRQAGDDKKGAKSPDNSIDNNRATNQRNQASSANITGILSILGYPGLKAGEGVTILNVGSSASGLWYVKSVIHKWDKASNYTTTASLLRAEVDQKGSKGGSGGSGSGSGSAAVSAAQSNMGIPNKQGGPPIIHGDIRKQGKNVTVKQRDLNAPSQATFTYGDGSWIVGFSWTIASPKRHGANKGSSTRAIHQDSKQNSTTVNAAQQQMGVNKK